MIIGVAVTISCDFCGDELECDLEEPSSKNLMLAIKDTDWTRRHEEGETLFVCPECTGRLKDEEIEEDI